MTSSNPESPRPTWRLAGTLPTPGRRTPGGTPSHRTAFARRPRQTEVWCQFRLSLLAAVGVACVGCGPGKGALRPTTGMDATLTSPAEADWLNTASSLAEAVLQSHQRIPAPRRAHDPTTALERKNLRFMVHTYGGLVARLGPSGRVVGADKYIEVWVRGYPNLETDACLALVRTSWLNQVSTKVLSTVCRR